jgi:hypothetical protein
VKINSKISILRHFFFDYAPRTFLLVFQDSKNKPTPVQLEGNV